MKNLNNLSQKLEALQSQKKNYNSINDISLFQFIRLKITLLKEKKINNQMETAISIGNEINFWYDSSTKSWIENPNINCRKYYKMERNAAYKKDLKLFKLGLQEKRPLSPKINSLRKLFIPITNFIKDIYSKLKSKLSKYNFLNKFYQKYVFFKSQTLPKNINKLAVNTASIGIKGYRHLKSDCKYIRNFITSKDSFKYLRNVIIEANKQVDNLENHNCFRESLKPENFKSNYNNIKEYKSEKSPNSISQNINNKKYEYSLSR